MDIPTIVLGAAGVIVAAAAILPAVRSYTQTVKQSRAQYFLEMRKAPSYSTRVSLDKSLGTLETD
jgi:hypothetical protein